MENGEWNGVKFSPKCPDILSFKGQKPKNCIGKRKGMKETEKPGADRGRTAVHPTTTVRAHHHGHTVVVSGSAVLPFPEHCVLGLLFGR